MKLVLLDLQTLGDIQLPQELHEFGELTTYSTTSPEEVLDRVIDADIVLTNKVVLDRTILEKCPQLKLICILATGTNNIDLDAAKELNIVVNNVSGYSTHSVAQHTFSMLFYLMGHLDYYNNYTQSAKYAKSQTFTHLTHSFQELNGKTFGIIGLGNIGQKVAAIASVFGANVIYYSTSGKNNQQPYTQVSLEELLTTADIISIHAPLTDKTYHLIGQRQLDLMKPTTYLLNTGRGGIVIEKDLAKALDKKAIAAAGIDVFEKEPLDANSPLYTISNKERLLMTPHTAWASEEARNKLLALTVENIKHFLDSL